MPSRTSKLQTPEKLKIVLDALEDKRANDVDVLEVSGRTMMADYFVVTHSTSNVHLRALADGVIEAMEKLAGQRARREGQNDANWVLLDYGDVVVHIFTREARGVYDLESLWQSTEKGRAAGEQQADDA
jgi:ribosome-associated protein